MNLDDIKDYDVQKIDYAKWPYTTSTKFPFCHVLLNGKTCGKEAKWRGPYFGDNELYYESTEKLSIGWVLVEACEEHASQLWPEEFKDLP